MTWLLVVLVFAETDLLPRDWAALILSGSGDVSLFLRWDEWKTFHQRRALRYINSRSHLVFFYFLNLFIFVWCINVDFVVNLRTLFSSSGVQNISSCVQSRLVFCCNLIGLRRNCTISQGSHAFSGISGTWKCLGVPRRSGENLETGTVKGKVSDFFFCLDTLI